MSTNDRPSISLDDLDQAPAELPAPAGINYAKDFHVLLVRFSEVSEKHIELKEECLKLKAQSGTREVLDNLIKPYASRAFIFMCAYCAVVGLFLGFDGFRLFGFSLPDHVLDFLVGSTATTVIGLVGMVLTGIFVGARK